VQQVVLGADRDLVSLDRAGTGVDDDFAFGAQMAPDPPQPDPAKIATVISRPTTGGYCEPVARVEVFVDSKRHSGNPATIALTSHEEIALVIGTPPNSIPSTYAFPSGE
jgi:hypothetical protein